MKLLAAVALLLIVWWLKHAKRMLPVGDPERFPEKKWLEPEDGFPATTSYDPRLAHQLHNEGDICGDLIWSDVRLTYGCCIRCMVCDWHEHGFEAYRGTPVRVA